MQMWGKTSKHLLKPLPPGPCFQHLLVNKCRFLLNRIRFPVYAASVPQGKMDTLFLMPRYRLQYCPRADFYSPVSCIRSQLSPQHFIALAFSGSPWALGNVPELLLRACAPAMGTERPLVASLSASLPTISVSKK